MLVLAATPLALGSEQHQGYNYGQGVVDAWNRCIHLCTDPSQSNSTISSFSSHRMMKAILNMKWQRRQSNEDNLKYELYSTQWVFIGSSAQRI